MSYGVLKNNYNSTNDRDALWIITRKEVSWATLKTE